MDLDAKKILWWSFVAGVGFTVGAVLVSAPIELVLAVVKGQMGAAS